MRIAFAIIMLALLVLPEAGFSQELRRITLEVPPKFRNGPFESKRELKALPGVKVSVFASGMDGARFMAENSDGVLFLSVPSDGTVLALPDRDRDGAADEIIVYARGLKKPHGLVFRDGELLVAEAGSVSALKDDDNDLKADSKKIITDDVPSGGGHWTRTVVIGPDNAIYVAAGSSCNACVEEDTRRAAVTRFADSKAELFATGLRNTVGLEFHPATGKLWGVDNGRDMLGDDIPPEEVNLLEKGMDYGWPYCYGDRIPDPELGSAERCQKTTPPEVEMQAHSAPLGVAFGFGLKFPNMIENSLLIAFHGSWNRSVPTGYKVVAVPFNDKGMPAGKPLDVITGWLTGQEAWGRPVDVLAGRDGAMYVSDDEAGAVYRVTYEAPKIKMEGKK
jgi:glucose/arabinose dehydrogenase